MALCGLSGRVWACALVLSTSLSMLSGAIADTDEGKIQAWLSDFPPFQYADQGEFSGYAVEVVRELARRAELEVEFHSGAFRRTQILMQDQHNLLNVFAARTRAREDDYHWIGPLAPRRIYFFRRADDTHIVAETIADLSTYSLGMVAGTAAAGKAIEHGLEPELVPYFAMNLRKFLHHRVEVIDALEVSLHQHLTSNGLSPDYVVPVLALDVDSDYYLALSKNFSPAYRARIDQAFLEMQADGSLEQLQEKYVGGVFNWGSVQPFQP